MGYILNPTQSKCVAGSAASIEAATFVRSLVSKKLVNEPGGSYNAASPGLRRPLGMFGGGMWPNLGLSVFPRRASTRRSPSSRGQSRLPAARPSGVGGFPMFELVLKTRTAMWEFIKFTRVG